MNWKDKQKLIDKILIAAVVLIIVFVAFTACGAHPKEEIIYNEPAQNDTYPEYAGVEEYVVQGDDTLLGIACKFCPKGANIYRYVRDVKSLNGRESDVIYWKETIKVYVFEE